MNKTITPTISDAHQNSFWYYGKEIVRVTNKGGAIFTIMARGEVRVKFNEDGEYFVGHAAVKEAFLRDYNDSHVATLARNDMFSSANWFEVFRLNSRGEIVATDHPLLGTHSEAVQYGFTLMGA